MLTGRIWIGELKVRFEPYVYHVGPQGRQRRVERNYYGPDVTSDGPGPLKIHLRLTQLGRPRKDSGQEGSGEATVDARAGEIIQCPVFTVR